MREKYDFYKKSYPQKKIKKVIVLNSIKSNNKHKQKSSPDLFFEKRRCCGRKLFTIISHITYASSKEKGCSKDSQKVYKKDCSQSCQKSSKEKDCKESNQEASDKEASKKEGSQEKSGKKDR